MEKTCVIVMRQDSLLNRAMGSILLNSNPALKVFTSQAKDVGELITEVAELKADFVIMEESTPMATEEILGRLLMSYSELHVIVVSEETNWLHVFHKRDLLMKRQADFLSVLQSDC